MDLFFNHENSMICSIWGDSLALNASYKNVTETQVI